MTKILQINSSLFSDQGISSTLADELVRAGASVTQRCRCCVGTLPLIRCRT